ncbi:MAG: O-antigen ligase family protein [Vicinamibacterales bacterium]
MERLTKRLLIAWVAVVLVIEARLLSGGWPLVLPLVVAGMPAAAVAASFTPRIVSLILLPAYFVQVLVRLAAGGVPYSPHEVVWLAPLFGALLPDLVRTPWRIPTLWRGPLVAGALVVAACAPIVVLRETDFTPGLLLDRELWYLVADAWPSLLAGWIGFVAVTLVMGVLWFDWLCGRPSAEFDRDVLRPLAASVAVLIAVTAYQYFVDVHFLNQSVYGARGRAGGTTYDANVSGLLAALWIGGFTVLARSLRRFGFLAAGVGVCGAWLAVWATASGGALVCATVVTVFAAADLGRRARPGPVHATAALLLVVLAVGLVVAGGRETVSPLYRLQRRFVASGGISVPQVATSLWHRDGFGPAAVAMVSAYPWTGVGVGMFHSLVSSFYTAERMTPDNAQNWVRHQVAELGIVGSAPWLLWFLLFAAFVVRVRRGDPPGTLTLRGMLIAFGVVSMISVPGQHVAAAITFWSLANWLRLRAGSPADTHSLGRVGWAAVTLAVILAAVGTAVVAGGPLRPPMRKLRGDAPYSYGMAGTGADGFRPTAARAVSVLDVSAPWLLVTAKGAAGADAAPVDVRVTAAGQSVLKGQLAAGTQLSAAMPVPGGTRRLVLEVSARRPGESVLAARLDSAPRVGLRWEFVDARPASPIAGRP